MDKIHDLSAQKLLQRLRRADQGWIRAMAHKRYRDEPSEDRPFTEEEKIRYWWADTWRLLYHEYEQALYKNPDVRAGMVEGLTTREPLLIYES